MPHYTILMLNFQHKLKGRIEKAMKNQNNALGEKARRELDKEENQMKSVTSSHLKALIQSLRVGI